VKQEIQNRLNKVPPVVNDEDNIKIVKVNFAYDNTQIISLLKTRGSYVASGKAQTSKGLCSNETIDPICETNFTIEEQFKNDELNDL
jgi:hypothetical protein